VDPGCVFWTSNENVPSSPRHGYVRKQRGIVAGLPDLMVICRGRVIFVELKTKLGRLSPSQRACRGRLLAAGVRWGWCWRSVLAALRRSGVVLGEGYELPVLGAWEKPVRDAYGVKRRGGWVGPEAARERALARLEQLEAGG